MATFEITAPNGKKYRVKGENRDGALAALQEHLGVGARAPIEEKTTHAGGLSAMATQGALASFGDEYMAGLAAVLGVQPDGAGGANWFQYDKPIKERYGVALEQIRAEMDDYRGENPKKSAAAQIGGAIAGGVAGGAGLSAAKAGVTGTGFNAAATLPGKVAQASAAGAAGGALEGFGAGDGGVSNRLRSSAIGAGVGAVFAPLVGLPAAKVIKGAERIGGKALANVFKSRRMYDPETGALTETGKKRLEALGFNPSELSQEMQRAFGVAAERAADATGDNADAITVARLASAERFGVPLTKGQATGDVSQVATEESFRAGVRGRPAYETMTGFDRTQGAAVEAARTGIGDGMSPPANRIGAAEAVIDGVRREADAARTAGRAAYSALEESGAAITGDALPPLRRQIESAVSASGFAVDEGTPNARAALSMLEKTFQGSKGGAVPFASIERARQNLVSLRKSAHSGSAGADSASMDAIVREFDGWLDDAITDALVSGDDAVISQAKNARSLWGKYRKTFLGRDGADNFIRKIVEDDLSPDQVAGWLYGASANIGGGQSSLVARRVKNILGADSPEFASVRRAAWDRITKNTDGREAWGPQRVASNISELLDGKGQTLGRELFSDHERRVMGEYRDLLRVLVPPARSTNPSGTSYQNQRALQDATQVIAGVLLGSSTGTGPVGAAVGRQAIEAGGGFSAAMKARAAANGIATGAASGRVAAGAGVGTGAAAQEEFAR